MLFNMVSAPNMVSQKDAERMVKLLPLACILHCAIGSWCVRPVARYVANKYDQIYFTSSNLRSASSFPTRASTLQSTA